MMVMIMSANFRDRIRTAVRKFDLRFSLVFLLLATTVCGLGFRIVHQRQLASASSPEFKAEIPAKPELPTPKAAANSDSGSLAANAKSVFRARCFACHGGAEPRGGFPILDHQVLLQNKDRHLIVPGQPDESRVYQVITAKDDSVMPPSGNGQLTQVEVDHVRAWIVSGAPAFPLDVEPPPNTNVDPGLKESVGVDYVLKQILQHLEQQTVETRPFVRFFSINHLLGAGITSEELRQHRNALAKAINHLSLAAKIVVPVTVDEPLGTLFAVDIRHLGWHRQPLQRVLSDSQTAPSEMTIFDLAVLEYPYGILYENSELFRRMFNEYVIPAKMARPVPYLRADWFVSVATQPPLYEDFLQLPFELSELEQRLGVNSESNVENHVAKRAGMTVSGVSRNNRVVERHNF